MGTHQFQRAGEVACYLRIESSLSISDDSIVLGIVLSALHLLSHLIIVTILSRRPILSPFYRQGTETQKGK